VEQDDFIAWVKKMMQHAQIILATPVYWYAMSCVMKTLFDRQSDLLTTHKTIGRAFAGREVFVLATGTDDEPPEGFGVPFRRTCDYFDVECGA